MTADRETEKLLAEVEHLQAALTSAKAAFGGGGSAPDVDSLALMGLLILWEDLAPHAAAFVKGVEKTMWGAGNVG